MAVKFKLHQDGHTVDLSMRISAIANGWTIKAGDIPYFCFTEQEVEEAVTEMLRQYFVDTASR